MCAQLCLTLRDPMDCSPPGSSAHGFPRQEYWSGLPFPSPGDLSITGIELRSPALAGRFCTTELPGTYVHGSLLKLADFFLFHVSEAHDFSQMDAVFVGRVGE